MFWSDYRGGPACIDFRKSIPAYHFLCFFSFFFAKLLHKIPTKRGRFHPGSTGSATSFLLTSVTHAPCTSSIVLWISEILVAVNEIVYTKQVNASTRARWGLPDAALLVELRVFVLYQTNQYFFASSWSGIRVMAVTPYGTDTHTTYFPNNI